MKWNRLGWVMAVVFGVMFIVDSTLLQATLSDLRRLRRECVELGIASLRYAPDGGVKFQVEYEKILSAKE